MSLVLGRLQDKSSQVRRYAIQLLTAILRCNPFAAKVSSNVGIIISVDGCLFCFVFYFFP